MEHIDILYDHYKDTVALMKDAQRDRDRFFRGDVYFAGSFVRVQP